MTAYSFHDRFAPLILSGAKTQTIRAPRAGRIGHVKTGGGVQLYVGLRTKAARKLGDAICALTVPIAISFGDKPTVQIARDPAFGRPEALDEFAQRDGFAEFADMVAFFRAAHGDNPHFTGFLIRWRDFKPSDRNA